MTRKLSLTTAVAVAALSVGAPAAFGSVHAQAEVAPNKAQPKSSVSTYGVSRESGVGGLATTSSVAEYRDSVERAALLRGSTPVSATSSGTEIEWPQVGIGLGIGILLALGLGLIVRTVHVRPFAH